MKLPAYGKSLLQARRSGHHPAVITVVYGEKWSVKDAEFRLAVIPGDALERDWRCVAGLPVEFVNIAAESMLEDAPEALRCVAEIARHSATVMVEMGDLGRYAAHVHAFLSRRWDAAARRMQWPHWWSEEIDKLNQRNRKLWLSEAESYLAQLAA